MHMDLFEAEHPLALSRLGLDEGKIEKFSFHLGILMGEGYSG